MAQVQRQTDIDLRGNQLLQSSARERELTVACFEMTSGDNAFSFVRSILISSAGMALAEDAAAAAGSFIDSAMMEKGDRSSGRFRLDLSSSMLG